MADLKIDDVNDLVISDDGDLVIVTEQEAIGQSIKIALLTHFGESVYARNLGTPWTESIFIANAEFYQDTVENIIRNIVENVQGVLGVEEFFFSVFDTEAGEMAISMKVQTQFGMVDFTEDNELQFGG